MASQSTEPGRKCGYGYDLPRDLEPNQQRLDSKTSQHAGADNGHLSHGQERTYATCAMLTCVRFQPTQWGELTRKKNFNHTRAAAGAQVDYSWCKLANYIYIYIYIQQERFASLLVQHVSSKICLCELVCGLHFDKTLQNSFIS